MIGQASIKVIYALNANDIRDERTYIDSQVLLIGKGLSKLYSRFLELNDSLHDDFIKRNPNATSIPRIFFSGGRNCQYWSEYQFTDIYSDNGIYTCYATMPWAMERYNAFYTEPMYNNIGRFLMSSYQYWGMIVKKQLVNGEVELLKLGLLPKFLHASVHGYLVDYLD